MPTHRTDRMDQADQPDQADQAPAEGRLPCCGLSRRRMLTAGAGTALGVTTLVACGGSGNDGGSAATDPGSSSSAPGGSGAGGGALASVADIPVGSAVSATDQAGNPVIVSRPSAKDVVAFSAVCTHMGCTVAPQGDILQCPCHGSTYDLATGDNTGGPAPRPLAKLDVTVRGGKVVES